MNVDADQSKSLDCFPDMVAALIHNYPLLVRVRAAERAVQIGKKIERGIRPSTLAAKLQALQTKPTRFKPRTFWLCSIKHQGTSSL